MPRVLSRVLLLVLAAAALFASATSAAALRPESALPEIDTRSVNLNEMAVPAVWRARVGSDPRYSDPALDESGWLTTEPGGLLKSEIFRPFQPLWYRTHVRIAPGSHHLAIFLVQFQGPERFYVNGVQVDSFGRFGPGQGFPSFAHRFFEIPPFVLRPGENTFAIQTNAGPDGRPPFNAQTAMLAGPYRVLQDDLSLLEFQNFVSNVTEVVIEALLLVLSSALMLAMRREREYRALVGLVASLLVADALQIWILSVGRPTTTVLLLAEVLLDAVACILLVELVRELLRVPLSWSFRALYWCILASTLPFWIVSTLQFYAHPMPGFVQSASWWLYHLGISLPQIALPIVCLIFAIRRRSTEFALLAMPLLMEGALLTTKLLARLGLTADLYEAQLIQGTLYVKWLEISRILLGSTLLLFLMLRTVKIARERAVISGELEAAQSVQQLLLGVAQTSAPGFKVDTAYLPASEVGGDFFYMAPGSDKSLLVVTGDVSGKGLRAAMTVSAIVGALRAIDERAPAHVLQHLNRMLVGHMEGFVTCCAALIGADGETRFANAGHLSPYLDHEELALTPNLPLGLTDDLRFEETLAFVPANSRLLFVSDGVVEATDPRSGELFGFERTAAMLDQSARHLALAAKIHGQSDDITVVSVQRLGSPTAAP